MLRRRLEALSPTPLETRPPRLRLGPAEIDGVLAGGLVSDAVHEASGGSAAFFAATLAGQTAGVTAWIAAAGREAALFPAGLSATGLGIENILFIRPPDRDIFWSLEQVLRSGVVRAVIAETPNAADFTQSRRFQLAARDTGALALLLTPSFQSGRTGVQRRSSASAAETRWHITPRPGAGALGYRLELLKNKSGSIGYWEATWDAATHRFRLAAPV